MGERLQLLMRHYGLSSARFADLLDIQPSAVSHIISGRNKPGFEFLSRIMTACPDINPRWLILGEGEMLIPDLPEKSKSNRLPQEKLGLMEFTDITETARPVDNTLFTDDKNKTPEINPGHPITKDTGSEVHTVNTLDMKNRNKIKSVLIFYTDGTFESFDHK